MTAHIEPFVASLWKKGSPEPFAVEELRGAADWDRAKEMALAWSEERLSEGGLLVPTLLYVKLGEKSELVREWHAPPQMPSARA